MEGKKTILTILDGWGLGPVHSSDAIYNAMTPNFNRLWATYPHSTLITFGEDVGLPEGQMGNSEVGHLNIGAGRVVYQELARINKEIREDAIRHKQAVIDMVDYCVHNNKPLHIFCLASDGGVHAHINHLKAFVHLLTEMGIREGYIHAFTDGRDTGPTTGEGFVRDILEFSKDTSFRLASIIGRYYAMDRDHRWERVKKAYDLLVHGIGDHNPDPLAFIRDSYAANITDEFLEPWMADGIRHGEAPTVREDDAVLFLNFRTDRPRQLTEVLTQQGQESYGLMPMRLYFTTMTQYDEEYKGLHIIYQKDNLTQTLGEIVSEAGLTQLRTAETEKYPHVTFFFSGGREDSLPGEFRALIPSPKVATYDLQPEMSAHGVCQAVLDAMDDKKPDFICVNFANTDMVGHTGVFEAAVKAAETVDGCLGRIVEKALALDYRMIIIADHGNSDYMINEDGSPNTAHTKNPVPCIFVGNDTPGLALAEGRLADVAPTILSSMGIRQPDIMTGQNLVR